MENDMENQRDTGDMQILIGVPISPHYSSFHCLLHTSYITPIYTLSSLYNSYIIPSFSYYVPYNPYITPTKSLVLHVICLIIPI